METHEIYRAALETFGVPKQIIKLLEETGEFFEAFGKCLGGRDKVSHVAEEMADVHNMIDQFAVYFDCEAEVERLRRYKLRRLEDTIEKAQNEKMVDTRADKVRAMSDREIALAMMEFFVDEHIKFCQNKPECVDAMDKGDIVPDDKCVECLVAWLQQPVEEAQGDGRE